MKKHKIARIKATARLTGPALGRRSLIALIGFRHE